MYIIIRTPEKKLVTSFGVVLQIWPRNSRSTLLHTWNV